MHCSNISIALITHNHSLDVTSGIVLDIDREKVTCAAVYGKAVSKPTYM